MDEEERLLDRTVIDPDVLAGKPRIRGHRIAVELILDFLAGGWSQAELLDQYPDLEEADLRACLAYAAELARGTSFDVPLPAAS